MKKQSKSNTPAAGKLTVLHQLCKLIPPHLVPKIVRECESESHARTFSHWSQIVALLYAQLTHALGLNDVCDGLRLHRGPLSAIRGATPPARNTFSHANRTRPPAIMEKLFWALLADLEGRDKGFGRPGRPRRPHRFRKTISILDSTVIELVANSMDWARHRRRKAAAKAHVRLDLQTLLPRCVVIDSAREHDNKRAAELTAALRPGEIVIADRGYVDQRHLGELDARGVFWVTREKGNMVWDLVEERPVPEKGGILKDQVIAWKQGLPVRRIVALVEVDGKEREMTFLTNNLHWSAATVADLYKCRWEIEVFFKQLKQTFQVADFLGRSAGAVRWQIWSALILMLLLRHNAWASQWGHSFLRLFALARSACWQKWDWLALLKAHGTAGGGFRMLGAPQQAYLPGFS